MVAIVSNIPRHLHQIWMLHVSNKKLGLERLFLLADRNSFSGNRRCQYSSDLMMDKALTERNQVTKILPNTFEEQEYRERKLIDVIIRTFSPGPRRPARARSKVVFPELGGPKSSVILQHEPTHVLVLQSLISCNIKTEWYRVFLYVIEAVKQIPCAPWWANYPTDVVQNRQFHSSSSVDPQMPQERLIKRTRR